MSQVRRTATVVAGMCLAAMLVVVPSAQAAVTSSSITAPTNNKYFLYNYNNPNTFAISGMTNGTTGDHVDVNCYAGDEVDPVATNVAVNANGTFSVAAAPAKEANTYRVCQLRAVPHGSAPNPLTPYAATRLLVGYRETYNVSGGPNDERLYDYYLFFQQPKGGLDFDSIGGCGIDDGYLLDQTNSLSAVTWYCNAWLSDTDQQVGPTRSQIQINGVDAWPPAQAKQINANATGGLPKLAFSFSQNSKTGDSVIHESDAFVTCKNHTYPATNVTCPSFVSTGVTDTRKIVQDHSGKVGWITDVFTNATGKAKTVDLLWQNDQHFYYSSGNANQVEYKFPGQSGYSTHLVNDVVNLPHKPGKIFVRYHGASDGDVTHGRGAIVYNHAATAAKFMNLSTSQSDFTLHQTITVPAHGSMTLRWAYIADFQEATVEKLAAHAAVVVKGCTVPNVKGKSLAAAKTAIKKAHCTVGKITHVPSTRVPSGDVVSQSPKAGTNVDYGTKVSLKVSMG